MFKKDKISITVTINIQIVNRIYYPIIVVITVRIRIRNSDRTLPIFKTILTTQQ